MNLSIAFCGFRILNKCDFATQNHPQFRKKGSFRFTKAMVIKMKYYLAIDIGASSGRHILGHIEDGKLVLEEIYRFGNGIKDENGTLVWDIGHLVNEVVCGIAECKKIGKIPDTVAIDTWGVDYVLLDENKKEILPAVSYRDLRTLEVCESPDFPVSISELYRRTGIQHMNFNTVYQLYCDKLTGKLDKAKYFLMMPDYLSYVLTGKIVNDYTEASTTNMVNAEKRRGTQISCPVSEPIPVCSENFLFPVRLSENSPTR